MMVLSINQEPDHINNKDYEEFGFTDIDDTGFGRM